MLQLCSVRRPTVFDAAFAKLLWPFVPSGHTAQVYCRRNAASIGNFEDCLCYYITVIVGSIRCSL